MQGGNARQGNVLAVACRCQIDTIARVLVAEAAPSGLQRHRTPSMRNEARNKVTTHAGESVTAEISPDKQPSAFRAAGEIGQAVAIQIRRHDRGQMLLQRQHDQSVRAGERDPDMGALTRHHRSGVEHTVSIEISANAGECWRGQPPEEHEESCCERARAGRRHQGRNTS